MKSFVFFSGIKRMAVKMLCIAFLAFSPSVIAFSNPIVPPPLIIEIYFSPEGWQIEMMNSEYSGVDNLDNIWLCGIYDTAQFVPGIELIQGEVLVVTQDDIMTEMEINQVGDHLTLFYILGDNFFPVDDIGLLWGINPGTIYYFNLVTAPVGEQSIAVQEIFDYADFRVVKEKPNTIGSSPFQVLKRADFSGIVSDLNDEPLADVEVGYGGYPLIFTGSDGHFSVNNEMFCRIFHVYFSYDGGIIGDSTISIEPDSANYFEFKLDTFLTVINEGNLPIPAFSIMNIPNPSSGQTMFIIELRNPTPVNKGVIKIYNEAGYIVDIVPVGLYSEKQEQVYNFNDEALASGVYFYHLEIHGQKLATGKMLITR